jgi:cytoskeleton protein RodZ
MSEAVNMMPVAGAAEVAPPGRCLAEARQGQGLTCADVARQLKLSVWQVEALEAGRYHQLPGPIFVRGFIRNYARLLKLDPDALLRAGGDSLQQPVARRDTPPSQDIPFPGQEASRWPLYGAGVAVIVGALAIYEFFWNEPGAKTPQPDVVASTSAAVPARSARASVPAPTPDGVAQTGREAFVATVPATPHAPAPTVAA